MEKTRKRPLLEEKPCWPSTRVRGAGPLPIKNPEERYIHLNPVRAGLIRPGQQKLKQYRWSSYPWYLSRRAPAWLCRERVSDRLEMGHPSRVSQAVRRMRIRPGRRLRQLQRVLLRLEK